MKLIEALRVRGDGGFTAVLGDTRLKLADENVAARLGLERFTGYDDTNGRKGAGT